MAEISLPLFIAAVEHAGLPLLKTSIIDNTSLSCFDECFELDLGEYDLGSF